MSFGIYAVGFVIIMIGLLYMAHLMRIPQTYMVAGGLILAGVGVVSAVQNTRQRDRS